MERSFLNLKGREVFIRQRNLIKKFLVASPILFLTCIFLFSLMLSVSYADDLTCAERIALTHFTTGKVDLLQEKLKVTFPTNFLQAGYDLFDSMSNISPVSPAGMSLTVFSVNFTPLSFMDNSAFDVLFSGIRILMLAFIILSVVKHVIEVIL